jgi:hypothetical protein
LTLVLLLTTYCTASPQWETLESGLDLARIPLTKTPSPGDSLIIVLRADPHLWDINALSISETADTTGLSARGWAESYNLTAAINAGLYDIDGRTHVGLMVTRDHENNPAMHPRWSSLLVFDPIMDGSPPFRLVDREEEHFSQSAQLWHGRIQNLRLIKRPRENRWSPGGRRWSEAALGEDSEGNLLLLYCPVPLTMHEFIMRLLDADLGIQAAQHLEGGYRAQLFIRAGGKTYEYHTGREFIHEGAESPPPEGLRIPNVIGLTPR